MPSDITVNFLTTQHKASVGITAAFPDVCKTPAPPAPSPVPIPYPNIGNSSMASVKVTKRVGDDKQKVVIRGSAYAMTSGDEPGVAMGVISNKIKGKSEVMNTAFNVKFEGKGVGRLTDPHGNNAGSPSNVPSPAEVQPPAMGMGAGDSDQKKACKLVKDECGVKDKDLDQAALDCGMDPDHAKSIKETCMETGNSATFRSTNPACMDKIKAGYPAKGCDIPNKTVTGDRLKASSKNVQNKVRDNNLEGFVGNYDKKGKLKGLITTSGPVSISDIPPVPKNTYTGDYDAHDFFGSSGNKMKGGRKQEASFMRELNSGIDRGKPGQLNDMVRHGPQANYSDYCKKKGKKPLPNLLVPDVSPDEPLLAFDKNGGVYKIETEDQLRAYYKCKGQPVPEEWDWDEKKWQKEKHRGDLNIPEGMDFNKFAAQRGAAVGG